MRTRPFNGKVVITTEYGESQPGTRRGYHTGVDYALATNTPVIAPEAGEIVQNGDGRAASDGRGFFVLLKGDSGTMHCLYHLNKMGHASGRVSQEQVVGYVGSTGRSTGPHLHWETRKAPYDGNSDFAPGQWLFAEVGTPAPVSPAPSAPKPVKEYVRIFGDYRTFYATPGGAVITRLLPNQLGGGHLDYEILGRSGNFIKIRRHDGKGDGWLYVGSDVSHLTQYYKA